MYRLNVSTPISCTRFGLMKQVQQWDSLGVKHVTKNMFILLTEGTAKFRVGGTPYTLKPGDILIIPANIPYTTQTEAFCSYYFCHFYADLSLCETLPTWEIHARHTDFDLNKVQISTVYLPEYMPLGENFSRVHRRLINCTEYRSHNTIAGRLLFENEFYKILLTIAELVELGQRDSIPSSLERIILYIKKNLTNPIPLTTLCDECNISASYAERLFKRHLNMTVTEYINSEKLYYACELIQSTPLNLSQISAHLGYSDVSYFSRIFKKRFGKAPSKLFPKK